MKSLKDFISEKELEEASIEESPQAMLAKPMDPPPILIMRRKSIRQFPNGQRVAMYHIDKLNRYVTIPYAETAWAMEEADQVTEDVFYQLQNIVENRSGSVISFGDGSSTKVDVLTAKAILNVHNALTEENKKRYSDMAHQGKDCFDEVAKFARKHVSYKHKD